MDHSPDSHYESKPLVKQLPEITGKELEEESFSYAMQLASSTVMSMAMQTVAELGVFDIIHRAGAGARLSSEEIVSQLTCKNSEAPFALDRLLRLLASHHVLNCYIVDDDETPGPRCFRRLYGLAPVAKFFVTNDDGVSLGPLIDLYHDKVFLESWLDSNFLPPFCYHNNMLLLFSRWAYVFKILTMHANWILHLN